MLSTASRPNEIIYINLNSIRPFIEGINIPCKKVDKEIMMLV